MGGRDQEAMEQAEGSPRNMDETVADLSRVLNDIRQRLFRADELLREIDVRRQLNDGIRKHDSLVRELNWIEKQRAADRTSPDEISG